MRGLDPAFNGKVFYPYCMPMYHCGLAMGLLKAVVDDGCKWAEEKYLVEQPTEESARSYMDKRLRQNVLHYERSFSGAARNMITTLSTKTFWSFVREFSLLWMYVNLPRNSRSATLAPASQHDQPSESHQRET